MAGGRPIEYKPEMVDLTQEYLDSCGNYYEEISIPTSEVDKDGKKKPNIYKQVFKVKLPSKEGLSLHLGIHRDTIYEWSALYPEFSDIVEKVFAKQGEMLIHGGLNGDYVPMIAKPLLTKHGYRDSQEVVGNDGKDLIPETIEVRDITKQLNALHRGTSVSRNGGSTGVVDTQI